MSASNPASGHGLDTSVVLRLLVGQPADQALVAKKFVEDAAGKGLRLLVSDLVIAESYFALHHHYGVPKGAALQALLKMLESNLIQMPPNGAAITALKAAIGSSKKVGFVDRLIHEQYRQESAQMVTFERAAARLTGVTVLRH